MAGVEVPIAVAETEEFAQDLGQFKDVVVNLLHYFRAFENLLVL
jgi:hypothetical protein